ncbi:undecaprenyldiphospho-muramoylpentapeptide beta-N-acetylglucosaminyltransferase [Thalassotalea ponticola]|uniref:undecaprenyldiphospho-muramoylpentapeptide beta-N-acetylglucosaminyltransferase n=1 Tax=Thalassotalea ponticola TaxID=1523392 RepID=UPI0025B43B83|nr:undecaprenyldiphospho-muramoylpentapeptide beta-N-acetylglucosaminyltransferase [Thalassotalea ponticola]MDN3653564.1 undecaprenyldiphospho-muramoylpentapeptide beta-N-acetylglucosaminyltransferase [Thalassotalea ponticola]
MAKRPTILIMAGGTGGHIFPGLAVAQYLQQQGWHIHWLGTADRMEAELIPERNIDISFINISGLRGKGWRSKLSMPFKVLQSVLQSLQVINKVQPDVVLGMGGYASAPGGVAAWLKRIPLVLHEQNAVAGMTNRYLAKIASKVLSAFPDAFKDNVSYEVVGNPVRADITSLDYQIQEHNSKRVLVVGGSLGAKVLNETVPQAISQIKLQGIDVWHQTGKGNQQAVEQAYQGYKINSDKVTVSEFIDDMAKAYQWADVVICRAGALTVSELAIAGRPAIFIPLPHAVDDHQSKNAQFLVDAGAAYSLPQAQLSATLLSRKLNLLFSSQSALQKMAKASKAVSSPDATERVALVCRSLVNK